jgi:hypothetical protein
MADQRMGVTAACPVCGVSRFEAATDTLEAGDVLTCQSCGLKLSYAFLQPLIQQGSGAPGPARLEKPKRSKAKRVPKAAKRKRSKAVRH